MDELLRTRRAATTTTTPLGPSPQEEQRAVKQRNELILVVAAFFCFLLVGMIIIFALLRGSTDKESFFRVAFGSCTSYNDAPQPIWATGVLPLEPDAWLWLGDYAYYDVTFVDCDKYPMSPECMCESTWQNSPPQDCVAGNLDVALERAIAMNEHNDYSAFVDAMCGTDGEFLINGEECERPILGIWDDHDYGWNNGNKRMIEKFIMKQIYLDGMGVPSNSPRRNRARGMYEKYTLNTEGGSGRHIDVFLLDERFERDPIPCYTRRDYCLEILTNHTDNRKYAWCEDFLANTDAHAPSCCNKDELIYFGWCQRGENKDHPLWEEACDPHSPKFGMRNLVVTDDGNIFLPEDGPVGAVQGLPFCDVLGVDQRVWLAKELASSTAALRIVVSPSVLMYNPLGAPCRDFPDLTCYCGGDDMDCYRAAQASLIYQIASSSCSVVLTGDFHFGDIKVANPGPDTRYASLYKTEDLPKPLYQVMASGLTSSTAAPYDCSSFRLDPLGLRTHGECDFVTGPNFGTLDVSWPGKNEPATVTFAVRDGNGEVKLTNSFRLDECVVQGAAASENAED